MKETRIYSLAEISHFTHRKNRQAHTALLRRVLKFINHQSIGPVQLAESWLKLVEKHCYG